MEQAHNEPVNKRRKSRLILLGAALFFIGFPLAGVLFSYNRARSNIKAEAIPFATTATQKILGEDGFEELYFLGTLTVKGKVSKEEFLAERERWGAINSLGEFEAVAIVIGERGDQVWQMVTLETDVEFENGPARIRFVAARRSAIQQDWKIEAFEISDPTVE